MPTYTQSEREDRDLLAAVMQEFHPQLHQHGVRVGLLYAHASRDKHTGEPKGPALRLHGDAALAIVKVNNLRDRVEGKPDATVILDGDQWPSFTLERRRAILDHELEHLVLVEDEEESGGVKLDDAFRPVLKTRPHDFVLGGFWSVVDRHKQEAVEAVAYAEIHRTFSQACFPWG